MKLMKLSKTILLSSLLSLNLLLLSLPAHSEPAKSEACASYIIAEAQSGAILSSLDPTTARAPASMVKLMTAHVILKHIKEGSLSFDDQVSTSAEASKIGGSQVYLKEGEVFSVRQMLEALLIQSANDAALALAQHLSGSREAFVDLMNEEAANLGMLQAKFNSPHGLPPSKDQEADLVSPNDMLILARDLIKNSPEILEFTKQSEMPFRDGSFGMRNHNGLLRTFDGTDGLKTGFYQAAGFCVATTAERKGVRLIGVLMGCPTRKIRDEQATNLLSKAFGEYKQTTVIKAGEQISSDIPVDGGIKPETALVAKDSVVVTSRKGEEKEIERKVQACGDLAAPVTKGMPCGSLVFMKGAHILGKTEMLIAEDIERAGIIKRTMRKFGF